MKENIILLSFFLGITLSFAQKKVVLDSKTKKQIPYAAIHFPKNDSGFYTTDTGIFSLDNRKSNDSVFISSLGYFTLKAAIKDLKDSIFLKPSISELDEVVITPKPKSFKKIGFKKKSKSGWFGTQGLQLGILIKVEEKYIGNYIDKVVIPFRKKIYGEKEYDYKSIFKFSVFSVKVNQPHISLLETPVIIKFNQSSNEIIEIDISNEYIRLNDDGVFICIEQVGELNKKNDIINKKNFLPGLGFSTKKPKGFIYFKSFYKEKFSNNWKELDYQKMHFNKPLFLALEFILTK